MTATPLRVLLVWDDEDDDLRVRDRLAEDYPALALEWAHTCAAGLAALARRAHDIALVADRLGTRSEPDLLREARGTAPLGPAIILTGAGDAAVAAGAAVASGVLDTRHLDTPSLVSAIRAARGQAELAAARDVLGATLDGAGIILAVNAVWRCFAAANGLRAASQAIRGTITWPSATPPPGMPMRRRWPRPSAPSWRGPARPSPGNTPATPPDGRRWFAVRVTPCVRAGPGRAMVAYEDITARRLASIVPTNQRPAGGDVAVSRPRHVPVRPAYRAPSGGCERHRHVKRRGADRTPGIAPGTFLPLGLPVASATLSAAGRIVARVRMHKRPVA